MSRFAKLFIKCVSIVLLYNSKPIDYVFILIKKQEIFVLLFLAFFYHLLQT